VERVAAHANTQRGCLACLFVVVRETECRQTCIAQSNYVALSRLGCVNDAFGNDFVNDCWLASIVKLSGGTVECLAHDLGKSVIKYRASLSDEWQDRCHLKSPVFLSRKSPRADLRHQKFRTAAPGNGIALKANNTAQASQVVRYSMIGLVAMFDQN
jgi:hypothetical protein